MLKGHPTKLSVESEKDVLRLLASGFHVNVVAERFEVGETTVRRIKQKYQPPSVPKANEVKKIRRRYRTISPIEKQWLFHLLDSRARRPTDLAKLARKFRTSEQAISEAIAGRKRLVPTPTREPKPRPGGWDADWRNESQP